MDLTLKKVFAVILSIALVAAILHSVSTPVKNKIKSQSNMITNKSYTSP